MRDVALIHELSDGQIGISTTGPISGGQFGIIVQGASNIGLIATGPITSDGTGAAVVETGTGQIGLNVGNVKANGGDGIFAASTAGAGVGISVMSTGTVIGGSRGIYVNNQGMGDSSVQAATVTGTTGGGILVRTAATGNNVSVAAIGPVTGSANGSDGAIDVLNNGTGSTTVTAVDTKGSEGIRAGTYGRDLTVTSTGKATGTSSGVVAFNYGTGTTLVNVNNSSGVNEGINALAGGTSLTVNSTGTATSTGNGRGGCRGVVRHGTGECLRQQCGQRRNGCVGGRRRHRIAGAHGQQPEGH